MVRHDLQTSDALGAAASQLGPNLQAVIAFLNKRCGLSHGKIVQFFRELFDIRLSRAARSKPRCGRDAVVERFTTRSSSRCGDRLGAVPDETGWKIGGRPV